MTINILEITFFQLSVTQPTLIAGMDEAGRGPAIGPMAFGLVLVTEEQEAQLKELGVKDSKELTHEKRLEFAEHIRQIVFAHKTLCRSAAEIDEARIGGKTLNRIEVEAFRELLTPYVDFVNHLQIDAADVNEVRFGQNFVDLIVGKIDSKHKGDTLFISVGAASILAKVARDEKISKLQLEMRGFDSSLPTFGSGYPTDSKPFLRAYVKKYKKLPDIARKTWKTCEEILNESKFQQMSLDDW